MDAWNRDEECQANCMRVSFASRSLRGSSVGSSRSAWRWRTSRAWFPAAITLVTWPQEAFPSALPQLPCRVAVDDEWRRPLQSGIEVIESAVHVCATEEFV